MTELNIKLAAITSHVHIIGSNTSRLLGFLRIAQAPEASIQQVEISYYELQTILSRSQAIHHSLEDQVSIEICEELFAGLQLVAKKLYKMANLMVQEEPSRLSSFVALAAARSQKVPGVGCGGD